MIPDHPERRPRNVRLRWQRRFGDAFDGLRLAACDQESLWVHACLSVAVVVLAILLEIEPWRWCVVVLCIATVISLELMNSAIERLVKTLHPEHDAGLAAALHMAAAAVLTAALGAIVVGIIIFVPPIIRIW
ncbi:MAG: diacylglycerol kinase [Planctomycetaceae bacterium]